MLYLIIALGFMFFAGVAMTINEGLWSNTISLLCILLSGLIAAVAGVPLGILLLERADAGDANAWYFVFAGMWGAFALALLVLRLAADKVSTIHMRFLPIIDKIGGIVMGLFVATMLTSFAAYTLWSVPIQAGESDWYKDASESRRNNLFTVTKPFDTVLQRFLDAEEIKSSFYGKKKK